MRHQQSDLTSVLHWPVELTAQRSHTVSFIDRLLTAINTRSLIAIAAATYEAASISIKRHFFDEQLKYSVKWVLRIDVVWFAFSAMYYFVWLSLSSLSYRLNEDCSLNNSPSFWINIFTPLSLVLPRVILGLLLISIVFLVTMPFLLTARSAVMTILVRCVPCVSSNMAIWVKSMCILVCADGKTRTFDFLRDWIKDPLTLSLSISVNNVLVCVWTVNSG